MPNNVQNNVTIFGTKAKLHQIMEHLQTRFPPPKGKEASEDDILWFDFNKVLAMPEVLQDIQTGTTWIDGKSYQQWRVVDATPGDMFSGKNVALTEKELEEYRNKYGATNWYDWATKNWGTKWNAYSCERPRITSRALHYQFDTAWGSPMPVIVALSKQMQVRIKVRVSGEVDSPSSYEVNEIDR